VNALAVACFVDTGADVADIIFTFARGFMLTLLLPMPYQLYSTMMQPYWLC
jgi:hypothetical protein